MAKKKSDKVPKKRLFVTQAKLAAGVGLVPGCKTTLVVKKRPFVFSA
jgi:hypothetical protein